MTESEIKLINDKFNVFLERYSKMYDEETLEYIKQNFWNYINENFNGNVLFQVYSELGIYNNEFYEAHLKKIKKHFDIRCNVLDVASGIIPVFGNMLAKEQINLGKGRVTLYDPKLILPAAKYPNMSLNKRNFKLDIDIAPYKLITGILPCEITETIIEAACINQKDFYIALCGCDHFNSKYDEYMFIDSPPYQEYLIDKAQYLVKKYKNGSLVIDQLDDKYSFKYPILYNKRK